MTKERLKMSPPWITYVNKLKALFGNDPDIDIEYDNDLYVVKLRVNSESKGTALCRLLPVEKDFGNACLSIAVIPANDGVFELTEEKILNKELFDQAFDRNPVYAFSRTVSGVFSNDFTYVVFKNRVVQFFNDNLNDIHGNISTLYQEIASDVFEDAELHGVMYCTDIEEKIGKPLGEWP